MITHRTSRRGLAAAAALALALTACSTATDGTPLGAGSGGGSVGGSGSTAGTSTGSPTGSSTGSSASSVTSPPRYKTVWSKKIGGASGSSTQLVSTVSDGRTVYASSVAGQVWALSGTDGHVLWTAHPGRRSGNGPAYADGRVFFFGDTGLVALDAATGHTAWRAQSGFVVVGSNILAPVSQGIVVLPTGDGVQGLDVSTGRRVWARNGGPSIDYGAADDRAVYLIGKSYPSNAVSLRAVNPRTGTTNWSHDVTAPGESDTFVYDVAGVLLQLVVSTSEETVGTLAALDPQTGRALWAVQTKGIQGDDPPAVVDGVVGFGSLSGLQGFDVKTGRKLYTVAADATVANGAAPCGNAICTVGISNGLAIDRTGKIVARGPLGGNGVSPTLVTTGPLFTNDASTVFRITQ